MIWHDERDAGTDEGELDDEGIKVGSRHGDGLSQDVLPELLADLLQLLLSLDAVQKCVAVRMTVLVAVVLKTSLNICNFFCLTMNFFYYITFKTSLYVDW